MAVSSLRYFGYLPLSKRLPNRLLIPRPAVLLTLVNKAHWNKDFKPGPYPRTSQEREAAAKKYGLIPEDYEPYPEEQGYGDYPKLPAVSAEARDPYRDWDYPEYRRNFNEPLHKDFDMYTEERYNPDAKPPIPYHQAAMIFVTFSLAIGIMAVTVDKNKFRQRIMPKQYPSDNVIHYTFESQD